MITLQWRDIPRSTIALAGAAALMLAIAATLPFLPNAPPSPSGSSSARPAPALTQRPQTPAALRSDYAEIAERPLFRASRRPSAPTLVAAPAAAAPAAPATPPLQGYVLTGVILSGDASVAMLRSNANAVKSLRLGESLDGWRVNQILEQEVAFQNGSQEIRIAFPKLPGNAAKVDSGQTKSKRTAPAR